MQPNESSGEDLDTARLVTRIQAGDSELFSDIYVRYFDRVYAYLRALLKDRQRGRGRDPAGLHQGLRGAAPLRAARQALPRLAVHDRAQPTRLNRIRGLGRVEAVDPAQDRQRRKPASGKAEQWGLSWVSDKDLAFLVERLPLASAGPSPLRYTLDLTHAQIAAVLGRSPDDVRVLAHRALRASGAQTRRGGPQPAGGRSRA